MIYVPVLELPAVMRHETQTLRLCRQIPHPPINGLDCPCGGPECHVPVGPWKLMVS